MKIVNVVLFISVIFFSISYGYYDLIEPEDSIHMDSVLEKKNEPKTNSNVTVPVVSRRDPSVSIIKENVAPFGLKWGTEYKHDMCDTASFSGDGILNCSTFDVPIKNNYFTSYLLRFSATYGLIGASAFGESIYSDPYGIRGIKEYGRLKTVLISKYGEGRSIETVSDTYLKAGKFYWCLNTVGCGDYEHLWSNDTVSVILYMSGADSDDESGWITIRYESKLYDKHMSEIESEKIQKLKDGL